MIIVFVLKEDNIMPITRNAKMFALGLIPQKIGRNFWPFGHNLRNFANCCEKFHSKFGRNYRLVTYGFKKVFGSGAWIIRMLVTYLMIII